MENNKNWILKDIKIEMMTFGEHKGKYAGKISFQNGESENFSFNIKPEMADKYIQLLAKDLSTSASNFITSLASEND